MRPFLPPSLPLPPIVARALTAVFFRRGHTGARARQSLQAHQQQAAASTSNPPPHVFDMAKYTDQRVRVKFQVHRRVGCSRWGFCVLTPTATTTTTTTTTTTPPCSSAHGSPQCPYLPPPLLPSVSRRSRVQGGREVDGVLKGFDKLDNLVLDDCIEYLRGTWRFVLCLLATPFFILVLHDIRRPFIRTHKCTYARTLALALALALAPSLSRPHTAHPRSWIHFSETQTPLTRSRSPTRRGDWGSWCVVAPT